VTTKPESHDEINRTAADWVARSDRGLSSIEDAELAAWLESDPRRAGAYLRMSAVLAQASGEARAETDGGASRQAAPRQAGATRRRWLLGGSVAAGLAVAGIELGGRRTLRFDTRKGEKRVVALDDGSIVTLNTDTRLEVEYSRSLRLVRLGSGEALFDVAKDGARPFLVRAGETEVRAIGTSFTVERILDRPIQVLVREGVVEVRRSQDRAPGTLRLAAFRRATVADPGGPIRVLRVDPAEVGRALAWQQGRLVFEGESLSEAAATFARYSDVRIVVAAPELADKGVAGVFDASDPVGFAQAAAQSLGARTEIAKDQVRISY
jgi:transmembrane sensor